MCLYLIDYYYYIRHFTRKEEGAILITFDLRWMVAGSFLQLYIIMIICITFKLYFDMVETVWLNAS